MIDEALFSLLDDGAFAGYACGIVLSGKVIYRKIGGFRSIIPYAVPMTDDTLFDMASITKILGPAMISLSLYNLGSVDLSIKLCDIFPDSGNYGEATILDLLRHSAGFLPELPLWKTAKNKADMEYQILHSDKQYEIGKGAVYSCLGYIILGFAIERLMGENLDLLGRRLIWDKLGMINTYYNPAHDLPFAATERISPESNNCWSGVVHDENARFLRPHPSGNAGIFSSLDDMLRFCIFILNELKNPSLFTRKEVCLFSSDLTPFATIGRSVGFMMSRGYEMNSGSVAGIESFGHTGFTGTSVWFSPHLDAAVVLLSNRIHPDRNNMILRKRLGIFHDIAFGYAKEVYEKNRYPF